MTLQKLSLLPTIIVEGAADIQAVARLYALLNPVLSDALETCLTHVLHQTVQTQ